MRRVDRWLGVPICALLTILRKSIGDRPVPRPPAFIVFFKLAEQGSTVLAWPAISNAIARVGRDRVYFVVFEENRAILDAVEWIPSENVLAVRSDNIWSVTVGVLRTLRRLRRIGVDAAIDLEFFARSSAILAYLSGASRRAGFHAYGGGAGYRGDLCTHKVSFNGHLHTSQAFETLVDALDREPADFAALTSIEVVTLFGPETPALFAALSPRNQPLSAGLVCSPCVNAFNDRQSSCTNNVCMQMLSVDQVSDAAVRARERRKHASGQRPAPR